MIDLELRVEEESAYSETQALKDLLKSVMGYSTIFERLDLLETEINAIKAVIDALNTDFVPEKSTDINYKDLNECIGKVIFAYGNGCTNKPTTSNGYLINLSHDSRPMLYNKQIWFSRNSNEIWVRNMENGTWNAWQPVRYDSGWKDLNLASGVELYGEQSKPQYRKIGNVVYLRGAVKNILAGQTTIATLPEGFRPTRTVPFVQNTSMLTGSVATTARWKVGADGNIVVESVSSGASFGATKWFPFDVSFLAD